MGKAYFLAVSHCMLITLAVKVYFNKVLFHLGAPALDKLALMLF